MPTQSRQKYCSDRCNNRAFHQRHPGYAAAANRKSRLKRPVLCRRCGRSIPNAIRKSGLVFCSDVCQRAKRLADSRVSRRRAFDLFSAYKRKHGCKRCGYNKCAAALDFHHVRGQKGQRITAKTWYCNSPISQAEFQKCILLCKNCHYEVHNGFPLNEDKKCEENGDVFDV